MKCECVGDARALKRLRMPTNQRLALLFNNAIGPEREPMGAQLTLLEFELYMIRRAQCCQYWRFVAKLAIFEHALALKYLAGDWRFSGDFQFLPKESSKLAKFT